MFALGGNQSEKNFPKIFKRQKTFQSDNLERNDKKKALQHLTITMATLENIVPSDYPVIPERESS